ncbi:unnamed protein product [Bursaphelenchus xylophilus]|uniref:Actin-related protein 2/3 complex subunit 5 n=1 Tax=Bursaphelenchus xylophilus TaxID=6326 RepID=A0A1I7SAH2_BURXY|nr:unnamed protein product [Bursaphelenchus xylophilus]CAG9083891.1 unnamed protein product [Bursaphelenchus xylophilus]
MAKNVNDVSYRKVDVDALDPDKFKDVAEPEYTSHGPGNGPNENNVKQLLQSNKLVDALKAVLDDPPLRSTDQALKDKVSTLVLKVLTSFKNAEIEGAIKNLNTEEVALLMRYVYKGMELLVDSQTSQQLCAWHAQLFQVGGYGIITQVLTARNRL